MKLFFLPHHFFLVDFKIEEIKKRLPIKKPRKYLEWINSFKISPSYYVKSDWKYIQRSAEVIYVSTEYYPEVERRKLKSQISVIKNVKNIVIQISEDPFIYSYDNFTMVKYALKRYPKLQSAKIFWDLDNLFSDTDYLNPIMSLLSNLKNIQKLVITSNYSGMLMNPETLSCLAVNIRKFNNLKEFYLRTKVVIDFKQDDGTYMSLRKCTQKVLYDQGLHLKLDLSDIGQRLCETMKLVPFSRNIKLLDLDLTIGKNCIQFVSPFFGAFRYLESLGLKISSESGQYQEIEAISTSISNLIDLTTLKLTFNSVFTCLRPKDRLTAFIDGIQNIRNLKKLTMKYLDYVVPGNFPDLFSQTSRLKTCIFCFNEFDASIFQNFCLNFKNLVSLTDLKMSFIPNVDTEYFKPFADNIEYLQSLSLLEIIIIDTIACNRMADDIARAVYRVPSLRGLYLHLGGRNITKSLIRLFNMAKNRIKLVDLNVYVSHISGYSTEEEILEIRSFNRYRRNWRVTIPRVQYYEMSSEIQNTTNFNGNAVLALKLLFLVYFIFFK